MQILTLILLIAAFLCFLAAAFGGTLSPRINMVALGLALWVAVPLLALINSMAASH